MDLAAYISELLNEQGTLGVPGLGVFTQTRIASYYNEAEGKFYPPHYQARLEVQLDNNDQTLMQYISNRNKVSIGSARFFVNKYVADLLDQVQIQDVAIDQLGWLYRQDDELKFKPNASGAINSSAAYGFTTINLRKEAEPAQPVATATVIPPAVATPAPKPVEAPKVNPEPAPKQATPVVEARPQPVAAPVQAQPVQPARTETMPTAPTPVVAEGRDNLPTEPEPAVTESAPSGRNTSRWIVLAVILIVAAVGGFAIYKNLVDETGNNKISQVSSGSDNSTAEPSMDSVIVKSPATADTQTHTQPATDSVQQNDTASPQPVQTPSSPGNAAAQQTAGTPGSMPPLVNDKNYKYTLLGGAYSTKELAEAVIERYKAQGINAAVLKNPPNDKYFKITFGFFETFPAGQQAKEHLVETKHLPRAKLYVETIRQNAEK